MMLRVLLVGFALLSLFWFPYPFTLLLSFAASVLIPPIALLIGILADVLYVPAGSFPFSATLYGASISLGALLVRRFMKARIMNQ